MSVPEPTPVPGSAPSFSRRSFLRTAAGVGATAVAATFAAGCGSNTGRGSGGSTIKQWYHQYGEPGTQQAVQRYAKAYSRNTVEVQWTPGNYDAKLASGLLSSNGPDTFEGQLNANEIISKQVVELDDLIDPVKGDFTSTTLDCNRFNGKVYAIPMLEDMQLLYYRKSLLSAAGLQPPKTVDELINAAKALTTKNTKGLFVGNDGGIGVLGGPSLWSVGKDFVTADHKPGFTDPAVVTALAKWRQLFTSGSLLLGAPNDWSDPSAFTQGLTAMQWTGLWVMPTVQKALGDDFGVLPWPKLADSAKGSVPIGTWGAMVNSKSQNLAATKEFVKWLWIDRTEYQKDFALNYGFHLPVRRSIAQTASKLKTGPAADAVTYSTQLAHSANKPEWTPKMSTAYQDALNKIIRSGADATTELKTAGEAVQKELDLLFK